MRIAVIGDTHGSVDLAEKAVRSAGSVDAVVHLGDFRHDGLELARRMQVPVYAVRGDNDPWEGDREMVVIFEGQRIFATHGHAYDVDMDNALKKLAAAAEKHAAEVVLFAHDHKPRVQSKKGILFVNPGTLFIAEKKKSFALIEISTDEVDASIIDVE